MDTDETPLAGGDSPVATAPQSIDDKLSSFDFDDAPQAQPAGQAREENEPDGDLADLIEDAPKPEDDDPEVILRDNRKVKISELKKAYRPDWETETKAFEARQREFAQRAQYFTQQEQFIMQAANAAAAIAQRYVPKPPDPELAKQDPFAYTEQKVEYDARMSELQGLQQAMARSQQQAQAKQQQALQQYYAKQQQALHAAMPELKDPVKTAKFWENIKQLGASVGYSPEEMVQIPDYRILLIADKAHKYDQLVAQRAKLAEKAKNAQPMAAPVASPSPRVTAQGEAAAARREALKRLSKTGSVRDAEAALSMFD